MEKLNLTHQKHAFINQNKCTATQSFKINKKLKPGLVASQDIWPGNGEGLFWFRHFINVSLTYPYLLTAMDPYRAATVLANCQKFSTSHAIITWSVISKITIRLKLF